MAEYGYAYRSFFTYSTGTVRNETREPVVINPFVPSVPKSNGNNSSEGHVTRKTLVPVTSRPYDDSATEKYPSRGDDDDQWHRKTSPVRGSPRKFDHDGYNGANRYGGDYYGGNKEGRKQPIGSTIRKNDNHDGYNNNGYGGDKGGRNKKDTYDHHEYDGTNNGYGGYSDDDYGHYYNNNNNKKEGYKPTSLPIRNRNDGHNNNGYGNNKEQRRPFGSTTRNNNHDDVNYNNRERQNKFTRGTEPPKISSAWTKAPRKGTQLSEPTHDIEKALELLRMEAAKREHSNSNNDYDYEYDNRAAPAPGNGSRFADLAKSTFDKGTGSPLSRSSMSPMEPASPNKGGNYGSETSDYDRNKGGNGMRTFANFNPSARPSTPIIDSREAEEKFNGTRVW